MNNRLKLFYYISFVILTATLTYLLSCEYCVTEYSGTKDTFGNPILTYSNQSNCYNFFEFMKIRNQLNKNMQEKIYNNYNLNSYNFTLFSSNNGSVSSSNS